MTCPICLEGKLLTDMNELSCGSGHYLCEECLGRLPTRRNFRCPLGCAYGCDAHRVTDRECVQYSAKRHRVDGVGLASARPGQLVVVDFGHGGLGGTYMVDAVLSQKFGVYSVTSVRSAYQKYMVITRPGTRVLTSASDSSCPGAGAVTPRELGHFVAAAQHSLKGMVLWTGQCFLYVGGAAANGDTDDADVPSADMDMADPCAEAVCVEDVHFGCGSCHGPCGPGAITCSLCAADVCSTCVANSFGWCRMCAGLRDAAQGAPICVHRTWRQGPCRSLTIPELIGAC